MHARNRSPRPPTALDVNFAVKASFYQYVDCRRPRACLESEAELLRRMRDVAHVRYATGEAEQQEVLKIELALSRLADEATLNRRELAVMRARLNELMGRSAADSLPAPEWTTPDVSALDALARPDSALARSPDVAHRARGDRACRRIAAAGETRVLAPISCWA